MSAEEPVSDSEEKSSLQRSAPAPRGVSRKKQRKMDRKLKKVKKLAWSIHKKVS